MSHFSAGGGTTYRHTGETTEWDDILIKKGIVTHEQCMIAKGLNPDDFPDPEKRRQAEEKAEAERIAIEAVKEIKKLENTTEEDLDEMDEDIDMHDDKFYQEFRAKRLEELKQKAMQEKYGEVQEIIKADWTRDVNDASKDCWVVIHLYQDYIDECRVMEQQLEKCSRKFKAVKFLKIKATQCIENWPDKNLPTLFCYRDGELKEQKLGITSLGGKAMTTDDLEWWLASVNIVQTDLEENPRNNVKKVRVGVVDRRNVAQGDSDSDYDSDY